MLDKLTKKELKLLQSHPHLYSVEWLTEYCKEKNCVFIKDIWLCPQDQKQNSNLYSIPLPWLLDLGGKLGHNYLNILRTENHRTDDLVPSFLKLLQFLINFHKKSDFDV